MAEEDLSHLLKLARDRVVKAVVVAGNQSYGGGVLVKLAMYNGTTELLVFLRASALMLHRAFNHSHLAGRLPRNAPADDAALLAALPVIQPHDWNMHNEPGRVVRDVKALSTTNSLALEFVMQDGKARRYALPLIVARFLADYLAEYRDLFEQREG